MLGLIIGGATMEIERFTGIPFQVVGTFALLLTLIPLVWTFSIWLKKRRRNNP